MLGSNNMSNRLTAIYARAKFLAAFFPVLLLLPLIGCAGVSSSQGNNVPPPMPGPSITSLSPTSGAVGTEVTITGSSFGASQGSSTVTFNGTAASVSSWGDTSIATTVPSGATTGNVVVTVGGIASNAVNFTVTSSGPGITSLSPTSGAIGTPVTITGSNFGSTQGSSTVTFNGTAASVSTWGNTSIATKVPTGATTGNVVVTVSGIASNGVNFKVITPVAGAIEPSNFGMQCGIGSPIDGQVNCKGGSGSDPIVWPTAGLNPPAEPGLLRLHDAGTYWAQMNPSSGTYDFTNLDNWLDLIAQHQPVAVSQVFTWVPCWDASNASGTVSTSGTTVTWVSGTQFYTGTYWNNQSITINGTVYTIASVSSLTSLTLTTSAGTQSGVAYSMTDPNCGIDPVAPSGSSDIPADLTASGSPTFNQLVTAFVQHCSAAGNCVGNCPSGQTCASTNLIKYYEMWNEWDLPYHWTNCGTTIATCAQALYYMVAPAAAIIKENVPDAVILMPSSTPSSPTYQCDFLDWLNLEDTNGHISDWIAWHVYLTTQSGSSTNTPEDQWSNYNQNFINIQAGGSVSGCSYAATTQWTKVPWANTETNFSGSATVDYQCPSIYNAQDCTGQIVRWQILHDSIGTDGPNNAASGVFWYFWLDTIGSNSQYETAYYYMMQYLVGGKFTAQASSADEVTWTAPFLESDGTTEALWAWTPNEAGVGYSVPSGYVDYKDLSGNTHTVTTGQQITLSTEPYLLEK
jgi:hypothetical protein